MSSWLAPTCPTESPGPPSLSTYTCSLPARAASSRSEGCMLIPPMTWWGLVHFWLLISWGQIFYMHFWKCFCFMFSCCFLCLCAVVVRCARLPTGSTSTPTTIWWSVWRSCCDAGTSWPSLSATSPTDTERWREPWQGHQVSVCMPNGT